MILATLAALLLFAEAAPVPAAAPPPPVPTDPVIASLDALMETWRGKPGNPLRGKLGLSHTSKMASDGEAYFWVRKSEAMGCGIDASGQMRCVTAGEGDCVLAIGFDKQGKVKNWKASGAPAACQKFVDELTSS